MLGTYFLQKFRNAAPILVVIQFFVLAICLFFLQFQYQQNKDLQNHMLGFIEENNLRWEKVMTDNLRNFEEKVNKEYRGFDYLKRGEVVVSLLKKYQTQIDSFKLGKKIYTDKILEALKHDFQQEIESTFFNSKLQYLRMDTADVKIIRQELKFSMDKVSLLNQKKDNPLSSISSLLKLHLFESKLLAFTQFAIDFWRSKIFVSGYLYDRYYAHVIPNSKTLQVGETFEAAVFLDKHSSLYRPRIFVENKQMPLDEDGIVHYEMKATKLGKQRIEGCIFWRTSFEGEQELPFIHEYTVLPKCN